jgi:hypothetical protein
VPHSPGHEYLARLEARRAARDRLAGVDARFAYARLATFALAVLLALLAWRSAIAGWWLLPPAALFLWHRGIRVYTWTFTAAVLLGIPYVAVTARWRIVAAVAAVQAMLFRRLRQPMIRAVGLAVPSQT